MSLKYTKTVILEEFATTVGMLDAVQCTVYTVQQTENWIDLANQIY